MASNKRTRGLDIATRNTLKAIESALIAEPIKVIRDGEFTADEYAAHMLALGEKRTLGGFRSKLARLRSLGLLKSRKVVINGKECAAYSKA